MQAQQFGRIINLTGGHEPVAMNGGVLPIGKCMSGPRRYRASWQT